LALDSTEWLGVIRTHLYPCFQLVAAKELADYDDGPNRA